MKQILTSGLMLMLMGGIASATIYTENWGGSSTAIPEGNPVGMTTAINVSDVPSTIGGQSATIQDISVNLDISGGYNGSLYGYLVLQPTGGGSPLMEVLLNRVGASESNPFGDPGSGFNVTLSGSGTADIHNVPGTAGQQTTGIYTPDSMATLDGTFGGAAPDGTWTLFLASLTEGGEPSTLVSWGVTISVVPEPITWALIIFAAGLVMAAAVRVRNQLLV